MATLTSKPIQVYLRPEQLEMLRVLAARRNVSIAQLVREGVDHLLADIPIEEDPLWDIVGMVEGAPPDMAERHDEYLAEMIEQENR